MKNILFISIRTFQYLLTGIFALLIIHQFIKIFKNLRENKLFEKDNAKSLDKISKMSIIICALYLVCLIGVAVLLSYFNTIGLLSTFLLEMLIFIFAMAFLILGIGIKILKSIYEKAIEYKDENDFTI